MLWTPARLLAFGLLAVGASAAGRYYLEWKKRRAVILEEPIDDEGASRHFFPSPNQSDNPRAMPPAWIVLHDTEGGTTASANAGYFYNPASKVSAHLVVDGSGATYRCVDDDHQAWHAGAVNPKSLGLEMVAPPGAYKRTRDEWLQQDRLLDETASRVSRWCLKYDIPEVFVDADGLKRGDRGVTTHAEVTKAFGGTHQDPGVDFPIDELLRRVARHRPILYR